MTPFFAPYRAQLSMIDHKAGHFLYFLKCFTSFCQVLVASALGCKLGFDVNEPLVYGLR